MLILMHAHADLKKEYIHSTPVKIVDQNSTLEICYSASVEGAGQCKMLSSRSVQDFATATQHFSRALLTSLPVPLQYHDEC